MERSQRGERGVSPGHGLMALPISTEVQLGASNHESKLGILGSGRREDFAAEPTASNAVKCQGGEAGLRRLRC